MLRKLHKGCPSPIVDDPRTTGKTRLRNVEPKCEPDNLAKAATTGHTPWKDQPPPPRYKPKRHQNRSNKDDDDDHDDHGDH